MALGISSILVTFLFTVSGQIKEVGSQAGGGSVVNIGSFRLVPDDAAPATGPAPIAAFRSSGGGGSAGECAASGRSRGARPQPQATARQNSECQRNFRQLECFNHPRHGDLYVVNIPGIYEQNIRINNCRNNVRDCCSTERRGPKTGHCKRRFCKNTVLLFQPPNSYFECELELPFCGCTQNPPSSFCRAPTAPPPICPTCGRTPVRIRN